MKLLNWLFPPTCRICRMDLPDNWSKPICEKCYQKLKFVDQYCQTCGSPLPDGGAHCYYCRRRRPTRRYFDFIRTALYYREPLKTLIHQYKYQHQDYLSVFFAELMSLAIHNYPEFTEVEVITAVPLYWRKRLWRSYNQSALLAKNLSVFLQRPYLVLLRRNKYSQPQAGLSHQERFSNVADNFVLRNGYSVKNKNILIIDDISTTGETINQCSRILKLAGARKVYGYTLAAD